MQTDGIRLPSLQYMLKDLPQDNLDTRSFSSRLPQPTTSAGRSTSAVSHELLGFVQPEEQITNVKKTRHQLILDNTKSEDIPHMHPYYHHHRRSFSQHYPPPAEAAHHHYHRRSASQDVPHNFLADIQTPEPLSWSSSSPVRTRAHTAPNYPSTMMIVSRIQQQRTHHHHHQQQQQQPPMQHHRYHCIQCRKTFSRPSSLRIHTYSHTGEKPHACPHPGCGRRFSVQSNMRRHLRIHSYLHDERQQNRDERLKQVLSILPGTPHVMTF
ncbi:hypothetical protein DFQ28_007389 [Apophysomyces sp. BC1034]|nr:hypothetical protein DFQ30_009941 [Apophysomyces sp. BC1015]KAG0171521.1 hypothetical protein DFQ29_008793 [Apophysomyces sp. BC1021]KAG0186729.1 hypothetical protein DFQ28_007389 [Apophysomyces sp. BC1034]